MRKYLATIFGAVVGVTAAVLVAARVDADRAESRGDARTGQRGGA